MHTTPTEGGPRMWRFHHARRPSRPLRLLTAMSAMALLATACSASETSGNAPASMSTSALASNGAQSPLASAISEVPALDPAGWSQSTYEQLTSVILAGSGTGKTVAFDMDNTIIARDIGEAVIGVVEQDGLLDPKTIPAALVPPVVVDGRTVTIEDGPATYYEAVVDSSGGEDPFREFSSLPLIANIFTGHPVQEYVQATAETYADGVAAQEFDAGSSKLPAGIPRPAVYPQMADLLGNLRAHGYDVWIVSAAIGWSARWMLLNAMNPLIEAKYGADATIPPDHVIAVFNLMRDTTSGEFVSDRQLVTRGDDAYLNMEPARLNELEILSLPGDLASWRGGKAGVIRQHITDGPLYLTAGDSFGDMEMMALADHRLVITRLNKPELAHGYADEITATPEVDWMSQPVISSTPIGFLPNRCALDARIADNPPMQQLTSESLDALRPTGTLGSFETC